MPTPTSPSLYAPAPTSTLVNLASRALISTLPPALIVAPSASAALTTTFEYPTATVRLNFSSLFLGPSGPCLAATSSVFLPLASMTTSPLAVIVAPLCTSTVAVGLEEPNASAATVPSALTTAEVSALA